MFLERIKARNSGILLYGITPPKDQTEPERVLEIAQKTLDRLQQLDIDALVVYDVQDESARTDEERPFPFLKALDPFEFSRDYLHTLNIPKIIYRPAGKFTKTEIENWVDELVNHNFLPVFVGVPAPDFVPLTTLNEAYEIWRKHQSISAVGAVTIPERHAVLNDEQHRMLDKMGNGVSYFISQCIFNVAYAKQVIDDLEIACASLGEPFPTVIFTLTACGSKKTLHFMEWLGIHIPEELKAELLASENILQRSVDVCLEIANELTQYCMSKNIPFGFNIESVAIRKEEIEASILMTNTISEKLKALGVRE